MPVWIAAALCVICVTAAICCFFGAKGWLRVAGGIALSVLSLCLLLYTVCALVLVGSVDNGDIRAEAESRCGGTVAKAAAVIDEAPHAGSPVTYPFEYKYRYDELTASQQEIYNDIKAKAESYTYFIYTADEYGYDKLDDLICAWGALGDDYPVVESYFRLDEICEGDVTTGIESVYHMPGDPDGKQVEDIDELRREVMIFDAACDYIAESIPEDYSAYDKYRFLAIVVSEQTSYDYGGCGGRQASGAYGAVIGGFSICEGYSVGFKYLCQKANLYCECVSGASRSESHMWNLVRLESGTYHVDITWCDGGDDPYSADWSKYFMVTQERILADHTITDGTEADGIPEK